MKPIENFDNRTVDFRFELSRLMEGGRYSEAIALADELRVELADPEDVSTALLAKIAALLHLGRMADCPAVLDQAWASLREPRGLPGPLAKYHALAAYFAFYQGSLQRCVTHLMRGIRVLETADTNEGPTTALDPELILAWLSISDIFSMIGFHEQAVMAQNRAAAMSRYGTAEDRRLAARPEVPVRHATTLDHQGNCTAAQGVLEDLLDEFDPRDVNGSQLPYLGYAAARYAVLGGRCETDARSLLYADEVDRIPAFVELARLGEAALAITERHPQDALPILEGARTSHCLLGRGEIPRLRSLAYCGLGDYRNAHKAEREAAGVVFQATSRLRELTIDGVAAQLDFDDLRRTAGRYADEANSDPLTGLPNRRHLERHVDELLSPGSAGFLGVCDIDAFKNINTVHGHQVGDQVLQHVAAILSRTLRAEDFLARYGGDEFVVVLPRTGRADAQEIADRLTATVAAHDWNALVPGTPVTLTMSIAELDRESGLATAFRNADLLMLQSKPSAGAGSPRAPVGTGPAADR